MGEGPCGSSSNCLRVWSGLEHAETAKRGQECRMLARRGFKPVESERSTSMIVDPIRCPGRWLSFNEVALATVQRCLVSSEDDGTNAQFTIYSSF
jgi:hypothetical protein